MSEEKNEIDLAFATTDELIGELQARSEAVVVCMVGKNGTYQVSYRGSVMSTFGLVETARIAVRRSIFENKQ